MKEFTPSNIELSVVIPCLNESRTLESCIRKANEAFVRKSLVGEIVVADNGSTDGSQDIARKLGARVVEVSNKGYGAALAGGFYSAKGPLIIMGDADDSYDFSEIGPFVDKLKDDYDFVIGCRFPKGGGRILPGAMPWLHRWIGNPTLSAIGRLLFNAPVTDFYCGLRGFRKSAYNQLNLQVQGMEFAYEMIIKASQKGMKIGETPITLHKDGRERRSHLRTWRDGWRTLRFMLIHYSKSRKDKSLQKNPEKA